MLGGYNPDKIVGGVEVHLDRLSHNLSQLPDIDLHLVTLGNENKCIKKNNLTIHIIKQKKPFSFFILPTIYTLKRIISKLDPDIIHVHETCPPYSSAAYLFVKKYPVVLTIHNLLSQESEFHSFITNLLTVRHEKLMLSKIQNFIVCSPQIKDIVCRITRSKVYMIPNGIDVNFKREKILNEKQNNVILYVGRLLRRKGVDLLINAIPIIIKKIPDIKLIIVGSGPEEENLKNLAKKRGLEKIIQFEGFVSEEKKFAFLDIADIFVLPSLSEPFGIAILEAMACGKPVIGSNVGGIPFIIENEKTGFLFESQNVCELAEKIIILLNEKELRDRMGKAGHEKAMEFSWNNIAKETVEVYNKIMSNGHWKNITKDVE